MNLRRNVAPGSAPPALVVLAVLGVAFIVLPLAGLIARAPWTRASEALSGRGVGTALWLSVKVSVGATVLALFFGVPVAFALARSRLRGRGLVRAVVLLPLVLPPVVAGIGLLAALGRNGVLGRGLARIGIELPFTTGGAIVAAAFVAMPLVVLAVEAGLRSIDPRLEAAAASMGAKPARVLGTVTLPLLRPALAAAAVLAWARALGEFGATITFAGNIGGRTQTLPLAAFEILQSDPEAAIIVSLILVAISLAVIAGLRGRLGPA